MISDGSESKIGNPYVDNAKVTAKLVSNGKHDKIRVFKMKRSKTIDEPMVIDKNLVKFI